MSEFTDPTARSTTGPDTGVDPHREFLEQRVDPDLDGLELGEDSSDLDDLDAELGAIVDNTVLIEVPKRPGYALRCRTDYTGRDIDLIRKKCRDKKFSDGLDGVKFASLILASMTVAIVRNGKDLELDGEAPITFLSKPLQQRAGTTAADPTVRWLYGAEGHVDSAGRRLMFEAGWGEEVYSGDPTE